jgi:hypothetical protein
MFMASRGRKHLGMRANKGLKLLKKNFDIEECNTKALTVLSALTGKDLSGLVNEALCLLIEKYQPMFDIDLLNEREISKLYLLNSSQIRTHEALKKIRKNGKR